MNPAELFRAAGRAIVPLSDPYARHFGLAEALGATSRQICRWEAGTHAVPRAVWRRIVEQFPPVETREMRETLSACRAELEDDCPQVIRAWAAWDEWGYELDQLTR